MPNQNNDLPPSKRNIEELNRLSREFPATVCSFTLAMNQDSSEEAVIAAGVDLLTRLEKFVKSGFTDESTGLKLIEEVT